MFINVNTYIDVLKNDSTKNILVNTYQIVSIEKDFEKTIIALSTGQQLLCPLSEYTRICVKPRMIEIKL